MIVELACFVHARTRACRPRSLYIVQGDHLPDFCPEANVPGIQLAITCGFRRDQPRLPASSKLSRNKQMRRAHNINTAIIVIAPMR